MAIVGTPRQPDDRSGMGARLGPRAAPGAGAGAPEAAAAPGPEAARAEEPPRDPNRIGIVFVHGVGSQKPGETLLAWSQPLLRLVSAWASTTHGVPPLNDHAATANIDFSGASRPFVVADVPGIDAHPPQTWVMTEAWWAARVSPPSVGAVFRWLVPREFIRLWVGIVSGFAREGNVFFRTLDTIFLPLFLLPATAIVILLYILLRLLRAIPYPPIQDAAILAAVDSFLVDWFGDVRILLTDRTQAANIRARVAESIGDCVHAGCGTIVLVGHSGGTIVGYMTLTDESYADLPVAEFITHGQGLGIAWRLGHIDGQDSPDRDPDRMYRGDRLRRNLSTMPERRTLRWHDFWATHDPAPAGGFQSGPNVTTPEATRGSSTRVFNRMSVRNDHGAYWDNDEGFVLPVARLIEGSPAGAPARTRFFPDAPVTQRVERRQRRVELLEFAWVGVMASAVAAVLVAVFGSVMAGPDGSIARAGSAAWDAAGWVLERLGPVLDFFAIHITLDPIEGTFATIVGVILVVGVYWAVATAMSGLWTSWDERERQIALQPIPLWRSPRPLALQLGLCAGAALWLFTFAATGDWRLVVPSAVAVAVAYGIRFTAARGQVRRPSQAELEAAGVRP